jgi:hypothetical protein
MWWHPEWRRFHKQEMKSNIARFRCQIRKAKDAGAPAKLKALQDEIDVYTKYEEYIYKSRQAQHIHTQVYGPTLSGIATAIIAGTVFLFGVVAYFRPASPPLPSQADTVLKVIEKSDGQTHAASKLDALRRAGLITIKKAEIQNLIKDWYGSK